MTLHYAKILDNTMRKSWEEATRDGMFAGRNSAFLRVELSDIQDEDIIEWEWIKHNLDAVRMPLGYCRSQTRWNVPHSSIHGLLAHLYILHQNLSPAFEQGDISNQKIIQKENLKIELLG